MTSKRTKLFNPLDKQQLLNLTAVHFSKQHLPLSTMPKRLTRKHWDRSIHLNDMKMTLHGLPHKGFTISLLSLIGKYIKNYLSR